MSIFSLKGIFGDKDARFIKSLNPIISKINSHETEFKLLKDEDFPKKTLELKERLSAGATLDDVLPEAFALVREASLRTLSQRHYDVQMIGGIVLHQGKIAEMRTGEGKTLVATLPAYLNALAGKGVHVVTTNDYLSRRDAAWMGQVYSFLGLSVSVINSLNTSYLYDPTHTDSDKERDEEGSFKVVYEFLKPCSRRQAYAADITYGTNNEYGFDYLRDNLAGSVGDLMQRGHFFALVDEVDSILIDESRTPLIISSQTEESEDLYVTFSNIAKKLIKDEDFTIDEKLKSISLSETGITKAERILGVENIYTEKGIKYVHHLETAVKAEALYTKDKDYVVSADEVIIVDPFTGRMQPGRRWSEGLHQAIEAKENVKIQRETRAVASITFQNYFRFYDTLAGMTGTAQTSAEEFHKVYGLDVVSIPTHRAINRTDRNDLIFQSERGKFQAIAKKIKELQDKGQPVLVGTVSIEKSELLSAYLLQESVKHTVLNAKNHEREGELIAQAGRKGSVMIATNMAGRGVDIMLGGNPSTSEEQEEIKKLGGLLVLGTERHEARRIDNQLRGCSGR
ncbi:MAG: preprotein translocase subunit SecA, partial [Candidatus Paceibacterota bacterium]